MTSYVSYAFTTVDDPNGILGTEAYGINDAGQIVGSYVDNNGHIAWIRFQQRGLHHGRRPGSFAQHQVTAINNTGAIAGSISSRTLLHRMVLYIAEAVTPIYPILTPTTSGYRDNGHQRRRPGRRRLE